MHKLSTMKEVDGSRLLDHCMIVFGGGISDGNRHRHSDLPVLLAGGKAHGLANGRHVDCGSVPMTNLFLALLEKLDIEAKQFGDSTGVLRILSFRLLLLCASKDFIFKRLLICFSFGVYSFM